MGKVVELTVPPVASKKNSRRWIRRGSRTLLVPSAAAVDDQGRIRTAFLEAYGSLRLPMIGPDDDVGIEVVHDVTADLLRIAVRSLGPMPDSRRTGRRRDLHGMIETLADGLEGVAFDNDRQVAALTMRRMVQAS